jgi:hypothetical protein
VDCRGSRKPRCVRYDFGEEKKTAQGVKYFELQRRSLDFDGNVFGEVMDRLSIEKFHPAWDAPHQWRGRQLQIRHPP